MISPCPGVTLRRIDFMVAGAPMVSIPVVRVHYSADPTLTRERVATMKAQSIATSGSDALWRREMEVEYEALEGERWFPGYAPQMHDAEPFDCSDPNYWTIFHALDPHPRVPHCMAWIAFGSSGDVFIMGELWPKEPATVKEYAQTVKWLESDAQDKPAAFCPGKKLWIAGRRMDTFGKAVKRVDDEDIDYFSKYRSYGLSFQPAVKSHDALEAAREAINLLMKPEEVRIADGPPRQVPRLFVSTACKEIRWELENVRYPSGEVLRDSDEKPETFRKHGLDCCLYIFTAKPRFVTRKRQADTFEPIYKDIGY